MFRSTPNFTKNWKRKESPMQKMLLEYAEKILHGAYVFGNRMLAIQGDLLIVTYDEDSYPRTTYYCGAKMKDGKLIADAEGYVVFSRVKPIIDEHTTFSLS
jgi:hypothetical protein